MKNTVYGILGVVIGLTLFVGAVVAIAQTWYPANSRVVAWDASPTPVDDTGKAYAGTMKYQVYIRKAVDGSSPQINGGEITTTQATVSLPSQGKWFIGIKAIFYFSDFNNERVESEKAAWSDVAADCANGQTFGIVYLPSVSAPSGLKSQ